MPAAASVLRNGHRPAAAGNPSGRGSPAAPHKSAGGNKPQSKRHMGNFARHDARDFNVDAVEFKDFKNPWTFYAFFSGNKLNIIEWFVAKNLLISDLICCVCDKVCRLSKRDRCVDGYTYRCASGKHEYSLRSGSIFQNFRFSMPDVISFMFNLLDGDTLRQNALKIGVNYRMAAPRWARIVREVMAQRVWNEYFCSGASTYKLSKFIQADESKFGRKIKYNTGCPRGMCVWIVGLFESDTGRLILLPVMNR